MSVEKPAKQKDSLKHNNSHGKGNRFLHTPDCDLQAHT